MFSGGKDSTAMLIEMIRKNMKIDCILFANHGAEWPQMYEHIAKVERHINRKITTIKHPKGDFFYFFSEHQKIKGKKDIGYGWCGKLRWGTGEKISMINNYLSKLYTKSILYHGIAANEMIRTKTKTNINRNIKYPLIEWKMTERDTLKYCYELGFSWDGLYKTLDRVSCWCCENNNIKELRNMYKYYPEMWKKLEKLQNKTPLLYKGKGVRYYSHRFKKENEHRGFGII